jgi:hypothetical protein
VRAVTALAAAVAAVARRWAVLAVSPWHLADIGLSAGCWVAVEVINTSCPW